MGNNKTNKKEHVTKENKKELKKITKENPKHEILLSIQNANLDQNK